MIATVRGILDRSHVWFETGDECEYWRNLKECEKDIRPACIYTTSGHYWFDAAPVVMATGERLRVRPRHMDNAARFIHTLGESLGRNDACLLYDDTLFIGCGRDDVETVHRIICGYFLRHAELVQAVGEEAMR